MFLKMVQLAYQALKYSPQRGDVSDQFSNLPSDVRYSPQRGDVSDQDDQVFGYQEYSPQRGDVSL